MTKSIIEGLWEFLKGCPLLSDYVVGVNFCTGSPDSAGIVEDNTEVIKEYISGASLKALHASLFLGQLAVTDLNRLQSSAFLEELRKWFKARSLLPELPEGYEPQDIRMEAAAPFEYGENGAKCTYQISITLEYFEEV